MKLQVTVTCLVCASAVLSLDGDAAPIIRGLVENQAQFGSELATLSESALATAKVDDNAAMLPRGIAGNEVSVWNQSFSDSPITFTGSIQIYSGNRLAGYTFTSVDESGFDVKADYDPSGQFSPFASVNVSFDGVAGFTDFGDRANKFAISNMTFGYITELDRARENEDQHLEEKSEDNSKAAESGVPLAITEPPSAAFFILGIAALIGRRLRKP